MRAQPNTPPVHSTAHHVFKGNIEPHLASPIGLRRPRQVTVSLCDGGYAAVMALTLAR